MNMKLTFASAITGCALLTGGQAMAATDLLDGWSGSASFGALFTTGNSETSNINGSASVSKQIDVWRHTAFGNTYSADATDEDGEDIDTADRFDLGYKVDRNFTDTLYGFGRLRYDQDDFGNIDNRFTGVVGVGNMLLNDGKQTLSGEIGIGAHRTEFITDPSLSVADAGEPEIDPITGLPIVTVNTDNVDGLDSDGAVLYAGLNYANILADNLVFNSVLNVEAAEVNTLIVWDNSLNISLSETISLSLGLLTRTNTDIGDDFEETDTATRVNVVFAL